MRNSPTSVMFFAAGFGTRMGDLTKTCPKPMIEVSGRPLIDHAIAQMAQVPHKVANLHYLPEALEQHLRPLGVKTLRETGEILETGGGLRNALPHLEGPDVFTMNTDAVWTGPNAAQQLLNAWDPDRMDALLLLVPQERAQGHRGTGDFVLDAQSRITRGPGAIYSGAQIIKTEGLAQFKQRAFSLNLLWEKMIAQGRAFGVLHAGHWCDVGRPEGIDIAQNMLEHHATL